MSRTRRNFKETMKQLSYDKPVIDRQAIKIRKSLDEVKKTLEEGWKKKETGGKQGEKKKKA
ncbi:MAG: hypothetical protein SO016_04495 [Lachnospiraceae bacterium]|nr:hypothetical protein [Robinsoniella sp.]MDY3765941.1 hypothetical protein [Lachnospiraceae bacterium]